MLHGFFDSFGNFVVAFVRIHRISCFDWEAKDHKRINLVSMYVMPEAIVDQNQYNFALMAVDVYVTYMLPTQDIMMTVVQDL